MIFSPKMLIQRLATVIFVLFLASCGTGNSNAPAVNASGKHPANWIVGHRAGYHATGSQCKECHGNDLKGGITRTDCFNQNSDSRCHAGGHGPREISHSLPFASPALHGTAAKNDLTLCQPCHGSPGGPGSNPRFNLTIGSLATGCEGSACHKPNAAHPAPWPGHVTAGNLTTACKWCHGATLGGGTGPACSSCHTGLAPGAVPGSGSCLSCHGKPPTGSVAPNRAGAHSVHNALAGVIGICDSCHSGGGSGTVNHANVTRTVTVAFLGSYNAKSGIATYNRTTQTCTNVSCHGGQTTPPWRTGSIPVSTACTSCHISGTSQYNSYFSGKVINGKTLHDLHVLEGGLICTDCHDTDQLAVKHFTALETSQFEGTALQTIRSAVMYNGGSCSPPTFPPAGQFTIGVCHNAPKTWR